MFRISDSLILTVCNYYTAKFKKKNLIFLIKFYSLRSLQILRMPDFKLLTFRNLNYRHLEHMNSYVINILKSIYLAA